MTMLDMRSRTIQFEAGTVMFSTTKDANGVLRPKLYIQTVDAYRYQRELSIALIHEPGNLKELKWEVHAYKHPRERHITIIGKATAEALIERLLHYAEKYPTLLFNEHNYGPNKLPRHEGFVHCHDKLLAGEAPSSAILF